MTSKTDTELRQALKEIGNRAGAPTMHYAPNIEREEQRASLDWISKRVREALTAPDPLEEALSEIGSIALSGLPTKTGYIFYANEVRQVLRKLVQRI